VNTSRVIESSRIFDIAKRSGMLFESRRPLVYATTCDAVPYVTVDAADPVEYSVPAALDVFKA
jgi:hypothetical protein